MGLFSLSSLFGFFKGKTSPATGKNNIEQKKYASFPG